MRLKMPRQLLPKDSPASSSSSLASPVLDSMPEGGIEQSSKRRCISSACMPCRKRKSKCDGSKPLCTACQEVYATECHYDLDADHRRKGALKRDIHQLTEKVTSIGAVLDAIRAGSEADVDDIVQLIRSNPDRSHESVAEMIRAMTLNKQSDPPAEPPSSLEGKLLMEFHGKASLDKSGIHSHYGHTSNLSLQHPDEQQAIIADQVDAWTTVTSDMNIINHLLESYFAWSHPFYLLFSEEIFHHGMRDKKTKYCTPLLVNAILALGCLHSDRPGIRNGPSSLEDNFFAEAKRLLGENDNTPALTTVQALGLMSMRQAMNNYDSSGRRYAAQMMSMAVELGLHLSHSVSAGSNLTASELAARRVTFWGCFVLETAWSVCVGRIPTLPRTAIRSEKPALVPILENTLWKPHGFSQEDMVRLAQPSFKYSISLQLSVLMEIVDDILRSFYAPRDRITSRKLQMYHRQLQDWYARLPAGLAIQKEGPTLPQVITLHIFYHNCVMQTFRPFLKVAFVHATESPRQICTSSANTISELLNVYKRTYSIQKSFIVMCHCVMSAAIIHLVNISLPHPNTNLKTDIYLAEAIRGLSEMSQRYTLIGRYLEIIRNLIYEWCKDIPTQVKEAMEEVNVVTPSSSISPSTSPPDVSKTSGASSNDKTNGHNIDATMADRKATAPEVLLMTPHVNLNHPTTGSNPPLQQNLFWTPYPDSFEGLPLALPQESSRVYRHMDITNVLDSGVDGDWPQWNRDGFTMGDKEGNTPLWSFSFEPAA